MQLSSASRLGPVGALLLALAFPLAYGGWDLLRQRKLNLMASIGVVGAVAAVPTLLTMRLSPPTAISAPGDRPVVLRRLMVVAPAAAGAARPELARPRR